MRGKQLVLCISNLKFVFSYPKYKDILKSEAALDNCSYEKMFWKYAANLQKSIHAEVQFQ